MRQYHRALVIVLMCSVALAGGLLRAYVQAPKVLTSAEVLLAARRGVDQAVDAAIAQGGLFDAEAFVKSSISEDLRRQGFGALEVYLRRPNDLNPFAPFYFLVDIEGAVVRFDLEGTRDPLAAIRQGEKVVIRADPNHPYVRHQERDVLAACLAGRYYHVAPEAPDFFARLENRTRDPYHFGFESLLTNGWVVAADYSFYETGTWGLDEVHRQRYGL